jgi:hypothetical protein
MPATPKAPAKPKPKAQKAPPQTTAPSAAAAGGKAGQPSLRSVLLGLLQKAGRTLLVRELAEQARQIGYRSKSKDFHNRIWVALGHMPEV